MELEDEGLTFQQRDDDWKKNWSHDDQQASHHGDHPWKDHLDFGFRSGFLAPLRTFDTHLIGLFAKNVAQRSPKLFTLDDREHDFCNVFICQSVAETFERIAAWPPQGHLSDDFGKLNAKRVLAIVVDDGAKAIFETSSGFHHE